MPYCRRCGAELPEDARFCPACGTPMIASEMKPMETRRTLKVTGKPPGNRYQHYTWIRAR